MLPTLKLGDIVVTRSVDGEIADGTVIVFKSPLGGFQVHRISSHVSTERGVYYVTRGDANNQTDSFLIPARNTVGELSWVLPSMGFYFLIPREVALIATLALVGTYVFLSFRIAGAMDVHGTVLHSDKSPKEYGRKTPSIGAGLLILTLMSSTFVLAHSSVRLTYPSSQKTASLTSPSVKLQNGSAGSSSIYDNGVNANVSVTAPGAWLSGWDKRVKITIDHNDIQSDLTNFPVLVHLGNGTSTSSGTWQVPTNNRDAWDDGTGGSIGSCFFGDASWQDAGGYQFAVTIPQNATILSAALNVYSAGHDGGSGSYTAGIRVQDVDNAAAFTGAANNIRGRTYWGTRVNWTIPAGGLPTGTWSNSPNVKDLVQHIVSRPGWSSGNYLCIAIWGQTGAGGCSEAIKDYSSNPSSAAKLDVTYTVSGQNDVSFVFDELQSDANRKKIAVTTSSGTSQCYVEIEKWDTANEQAWLWAKVTSVSSTADTILYLYYDRDHADNTDYVGDTSSTAARNVWDSSFKGVWHLGETSGGTGAIRDSTSNNNVGTNYGSPTFNAVGRINSAISFDGIDDFVSIPNSGSLQFTSSLTIEAWINLDSFGSSSDVDIILRKGEGNPNNYQLAVNDRTLALMIEESDGGGLNSSAILSATTWYYVAGTWNGYTREVYLDGSQNGSGPKTGSIVPDTRAIYIGGRSGTDLSDGIIDEVRASNTTRSAAWIKASYESGRDHLLHFGSEEPSAFDYVLRVVNQVSDAWKVNLKVYDSLNLGRLVAAKISFHDGSTSDQVIINSGVITQSEGLQYDLAGSGTIYISISNLQSNASGTSYLYVYLRSLVPSSGVYTLYGITLRID